MGAERRIGGVRWRLRDGVPPDQAVARIETALSALRSGEARNQKHGRRKELYPIEAAGGRMLLKVNHYRGADRFWRRLRGSKAHRELHIASEVARRGIATPLPIAAGEARRGVALETCYLLIPFVEGARDLRFAAAEGALSPRVRRRLGSAFGALSRRIHEAGIFQDDFAPNNFLVEPEPVLRLSMIDFERARLRRRTSQRERISMLAKLDRELSTARLGDRGRFLRAYAGGDRAEAHALWRAVESAGAELARRDLRRLMRAASRAGRRFTPLRGGGLEGFAVRDADPEVLLRVAEGALRAEAGAVPGDAWIRVTSGGPRDAASLWARAILLGRRGLAPTPSAVLGDGRQLVLVADRAPEAVLLVDHPARKAARRALAALLDRLLRLGALAGEPQREDFGLVAGRAVLLAPERLRLPGRPSPDARVRSRALAERLLLADPTT